MKNITRTVIILFALLLVSCSDSKKYDEEISEINDKIEKLEKSINELKEELEDYANNNTKETEPIIIYTEPEVEEIFINKGEKYSIGYESYSMDLTLADVYRGKDLIQIRNRLCPNYLEMEEDFQRSYDNRLSREYSNDGEVIIFTFDITNTGTLGISELFFIRQTIVQNSNGNEHFNIRLASKYDFGLSVFQSSETNRPGIEEGFGVDILKSKKMILVAKIPEEIKGAPYQLQFSIPKKVYKYNAI